MKNIFVNDTKQDGENKANYLYAYTYRILKNLLYSANTFISLYMGLTISNYCIYVIMTMAC